MGRSSDKAQRRTAQVALLLLGSMLASLATSAPEDHFVTTWKVDPDDTSITIPMVGGPYDVDWDSDGVFDEFGLFQSRTHSYATAGTYTVRVRGVFDSIRFRPGDNAEKATAIEQWGTNQWTTMRFAFAGTKNLVVSASDKPDLSAVTSLSGMFSGAHMADPNTEDWDTSSVTDMSSMFHDAENANPDVRNWDTSSVTNMGLMFAGATSFDGDVSLWDVSRLEYALGMFSDNALSRDRYDALLVSWSQQAVQADVYFGAGDSRYCSDEAVAARQRLVADFNWRIYDAGQRCPVPIYSSDDFVTSWVVGEGDTTITIPIRGGPYNADWDNDGVFDEVGLFDAATHDFHAPGLYVVRLEGAFDSMQFNNGGDKDKIVAIEQWGSNPWKTMGGAFFGARNLEIFATDTPDFSNVTSMFSMFRDATKANPDTRDWDTSSVTSMRSMFRNASLANPDTSQWDTSSATDMAFMFAGAGIANPNTQNWDTSAVTTMRSMFQGAMGATPDTSAWDTSDVTDMSSLFSAAVIANPDTRDWDTSNVVTMSRMFQRTNNAAPDTSNWDTSSVTNMSRMFAEAHGANPDTSHWDTSSVINMSRMFKGSGARPDTSNWDTSSVINMAAMFSDAHNANPDTSGWNTSSVMNMNGMFADTNSADPDTSRWNTSLVTSMVGMFRKARAANPDTRNWDTSSVVAMSYMFEDAPMANPDITNWNTSSLERIDRMFRDATSFTGDPSTWDVSNVTRATDMFRGTTMPPANYDSLLVGWGSQELQENVQFHAGDSLYCAQEAAEARQEMIESGWTITDRGRCRSPQRDFVSVWTVTADDTTIEIPLIGGPYDVDWTDDGVVDVFGLRDSVVHDFASAGTYTVRIRRSFDAIEFNNRGDKDKIVDIVQWGSNSWATMAGAFYGARNLVVSATDIPDLSNAVSMFSMFRDAPLVDPDTSNWDTSSVTNMRSMFRDAVSANPDTSNWDTSSVTDMSNMFAGALAARPDTSDWDTSAVTNMAKMFAGADAADPDTSNWDTSRVTTMRGMFLNAVSANPETGNWDTSQVTNMREMFAGAEVADPDTSSWDTSGVTTMRRMFLRAEAADPDTSSWNTSAVTIMGQMFYGASVAAPDTSDWDTNAVTHMWGMFQQASNANPDVSGWDTSSLQNTSGMFSAASAFDGDLSSWDVSALRIAIYMFAGGAGLSQANYDALLIGWSQQPLRQGVGFHAGNSKYCSDAAAEARDRIISDFGWTITDGGRCATEADKAKQPAGTPPPPIGIPTLHPLGLAILVLLLVALTATWKQRRPDRH